MSRKYLNPPIVEAVCEFRLPQESKWDLTIPGLIYEKVNRDFPHKEQRLIQEVELVQTSQGIQQQIRTNERVLFLTDNRKMFIQVGQSFLALNCLQPYPTWETFMPWIEKIFKSLRSTVDFEKLQRIGLRYLNRIEITRPQVKLEDYFEFYPFLGQQLPQDLESFVIQCLLSFFDKQDYCKLQLTNALEERPGSVNLLLDLDYFLAKPQTVNAVEALNWVNRAHQTVENVFEGCIGERLREIFKEVKT